MATITPRRGYHVLNWTDPTTGERHQRSLGKVGTIPKRDLDDILRIKEYELSTGARILNANRRPAPPFDVYVKTYQLWHQGEYPDSTFRVQQIVADHLVPHFGSTPLNLLTVEQGEEYKVARRPLVKAWTLNKEWRVLMAIINRAVDTKVVAENPLTAVKAPKPLDSKPHHYYQEHELKLLYRQSAYGAIWRFMANTGVRRGEALNLRRIWITDAVRIESTGEERTKAGEWRKIPLTEGARKALERIKAEGVYLLPRMAPGSLSRAFAKDAKRAGVGGSLHCLRHTYICHLLLAGVPIRTVQLYAGHASISTTEKYAYQVLSQDPKAALRLAI
jgi:integrase